MSNNDGRSNFTVLAGVALLVLGVLLLTGQFFGPVLNILWRLFAIVAGFAWPLILIGIGVLLIMRAKGAGWNTQGRKYYRSRSDRMLAGVLGGFAHYIGVDPTIVRVAYAFLTLITGIGTGIILYIVAVLIVPEEPYAEGYMPPPAPSVPGPAYTAPTPPPAAPTPPAPATAPTPPAPTVTAPEPPAAPAPTVPPTADPSTTPPQAPPVPPAPTVL
jgi:phage shock protein PspC (stress-responsive transcriptional regulator)